MWDYGSSAEVCKDPLGAPSDIVIYRNRCLSLTFLLSSEWIIHCLLLYHISYELFAAKDFYPKVSPKRKTPVTLGIY